MRKKTERGVREGVKEAGRQETKRMPECFWDHDVNIWSGIDVARVKMGSTVDKNLICSQVQVELVDIKQQKCNQPIMTSSSYCAAVPGLLLPIVNNNKNPWYTI